MTTILLATRNRHKADELRKILGGGHRFLTMNDFPGTPTPMESADSFAGNATIKVASLASWLAQKTPPKLQEILEEKATTLFALADDSGLEVDFLGGAPGVHSARFAALDVGGGNSPDSANNAKLLRLLEGVPMAQRTARFRCVLAGARLPYATLTRRLAPFAEGQVFTCQGACEGTIALAPLGQGGFGYDPLFIPNGQTKSFAELGEKVKNGISHRAQALEKLKRSLAAA
jgi:XTP/dITP diphosphohydrolase